MLTLIARLESQLDAVPFLVDGMPQERLRRTPREGVWTAHDHLAHLARYQHMFLADRCRRILEEERPQIERYRAEDDPEWPSWQQRSTAAVVQELSTGRTALVRLLRTAADADWRRVGVHRVFGPLPLADWIQFFLIHEGHHLYMAWVRSRE